MSGDTEQPFTDGDALRLALAKLNEAEQYITELYGAGGYGAQST